VVVARPPATTSTGRPQAVGEAWVNVGLVLMPPSTRTCPMSSPVSASTRLDQVGAALGDPLEHGPHEMGPGRPPGHAEQRAPRP